jgi:hypothetical protein
VIIDELDYYQEVDLPIFQAEFADWLPEKIFDVHTHSWRSEHNLEPIFNERVGLVFEAESVAKEELQEAYQLLFPGKKLEHLVFGMPLTTVDRLANNHYISQSITKPHSVFTSRIQVKTRKRCGETCGKADLSASNHT